jgi:zinc transport system substrate-binding protein
LEFGNAQIMVDHIAQGFARKDPERARLYLDRAEQYNDMLKTLDQKYEKALASCKHKILIYAGHFAFGYFADRYGFTHVSPYVGFSPSAEPSPRRIAELVKTMKAMDMKAVFYEEGVLPRVAGVIAKETGAELLLLHGAHNVTRDELDQGVTYLSIMENNLERLKKGLECP